MFGSKAHFNRVLETAMKIREANDDWAAAYYIAGIYCIKDRKGMNILQHHLAK